LLQPIKMDSKQLIKEIVNKNFQPIYFLHGEEGFFMDEITKALIDNVLDEGERDFNQSIFYGKDTDISTIVNEAKGYPIMSERRLVVLKEGQDIKNYDALESYCENPLKSTVLVINYKYKTFDSRKKVMKLAAKAGIVFKSEKVKEYKLADWISGHVKDIGFGITSKASILLAEFLGNDLSRITNELSKLSILLEKGTTINEIHIEENIGISKDYNVFELKNAIAVRDVPKAYKIVYYFEHNPKATDIVVVVSTIFTFFSQLMRIHFLSNKSRESVAAALKVHPFAAGELMSSAKVYNPKKIAANLAILYEYDLKSKGVGNSSFSKGDLMREMIYRLMH
jgi:DNA polymerase-3 subunit delta